MEPGLLQRATGIRPRRNFSQLGIFFLLGGLGITLSVYAVYFQQMLQIRWRRWLTRRYLSGWLANRAYYQLQLRLRPSSGHLSIAGGLASLFRKADRVGWLDASGQRFLLRL